VKMIESCGVVGVRGRSARSGRGLDRGRGSMRGARRSVTRTQSVARGWAGSIGWLGGLGDGSIGPSLKVMNSMCVYIYTYIQYIYIEPGLNMY
jgi:hypothetical protein